MNLQKQVNSAFSEVAEELARVKTQWPNNFTNLHEGYAVLLEEVDELWDLVRMKDNFRYLEHVRREARQVATVALRIMIELAPEKDTAEPTTTPLDEHVIDAGDNGIRIRRDNWEDQEADVHQPKGGAK